MQRQDGFEVLEWLQTHPTLRHLPTVVLSSSAEPRDIQRAYQLGANSCLIKPVEHEGYVGLANSIKEYWLDWDRSPLIMMGTPPNSRFETQSSVPR